MFCKRAKDKSMLSYFLKFNFMIGTLAYFIWKTFKSFLFFSFSRFSHKRPKKKLSHSEFSIVLYYLISTSRHTNMISKSESLVSAPKNELPYYSIKYLSLLMNCSIEVLRIVMKSCLITGRFCTEKDFS